MTVCSAVPRDALALVAAFRVHAGSVDAGRVDLALIDVDLAGLAGEARVRAVALELIEKVAAFPAVATRARGALVNVGLTGRARVTGGAQAFVVLQRKKNH